MKKRFFILLVLVIFILGIFFFYSYILEAMARFLVVEDKLVPADIIIVLSGDSNGERVREGVRLYQEGYAPKILMSGGPLEWKLTYADWMKRHALSIGAVPSDILLEDKSRSTLENAKLSLPILKKHGFNSAILVTSPQHTRRARRVFRKVFSKEDIKIFSYPVQNSEFQLVRWWTRHEDTQQVGREYIALFFYFLKGY